MASKSSRRGRHPWLGRSKEIGLAHARKMTGFPVETFVQWIESYYGPAVVNFTHAQEAAPNDQGVMVPIPGTEKIFLNIHIRFLIRPEEDSEVVRRLETKLRQLGVKDLTPFTMSARIVADSTEATISYLMGNIELA